MKGLGIGLVLLSAVFFSIGSLLAKYLNIYYPMPAVQLTCLRFFIGLICVSGYILITKKKIAPVRARYMVLRGATNAVAIFLFFWSMTMTTVTKANMLNMTFPVYVFLLAPLITREKFKKNDLFFLLVALAGIYLVVFPDFGTVSKGDIIGFFSGITAGASTVFLKEARKDNPVHAILFFLYTIATALTLIATIPVAVTPSGMGLVLAILSGICGLMGQVTFSQGMRHISSPTASLLSTFRIAITAVLGLIVFSDPLTVRLICGGLLIVAALIGVSGFFSKPSTAKKQRR